MPLNFHIDSETLKGLFPFHIAFDRHLHIQAIGKSLQKMCPDISENDSWQDAFTVSHPPCLQLSFDVVSQQLNSIFVLCSVKTGIELKGQMIVDRKNELIIFLCSPVIRQAYEMRTKGIRLSDFAKHDQMCDYLFMMQVHQRTLDELNASLEELTRINKALVESEKRFLQAQKMEALGTLVGGIAHDFNNMLAGMTGNLYLAKRKVEDRPEVLKKLNAVEEMSYRAAEMIKQLLAFARKGGIETKPLGLISFFKEFSKFCKSTIPENIQFTQQLHHEELTIKGDATQLQQVLMNLLNNAHDAVIGVAEPEISLKVEAFRADEGFMSCYSMTGGRLFAHMIVKDNGIGIGDEQKEHIFEPFYTTKEVGAGTGLGLAMSYGAIKSHGGILEVESKLGEGTSFHIYLPLLEESKIDIESEELAEAVSGNGELILIVDDNADIRTTSRELLEHLGYRVLEASDGLKAVDMFIANQDDISLTLMDVVMPRLGGVQVARRIREISADAKVIFATGYDKDETLRSEMPSDEYVTLSKPYNVIKLSQIIKEHLES